MPFGNLSLSNGYAALITAWNTKLTAIANRFRDQASGDDTNQIRYNSTTKRDEVWNGSAWVALDVTGESVGDSVKWGGSTKTVSTADPSGGSNGDIWFKYTP